MGCETDIGAARGWRRHVLMTPRQTPGRTSLARSTARSRSGTMSAVSNALPLFNPILRLTHRSPIGQYNATTFEGAGHWTQVVWKGTTQVGCAVATCNNIFPAKYGPAKYYVCEYYPQGNIIGQFPCVLSASSFTLSRADKGFALQSECFRIIALVAVITGLCG